MAWVTKGEYFAFIFFVKLMHIIYGDKIRLSSYMPRYVSKHNRLSDIITGIPGP